jgi:MFS family permease
MGFGSMLMDISSEMVHSLLPVFMVSVLGASMVSVGLIEGVAEATASFVKAFSGALSDRWRNRKLPMLFGYGLSALTKPVFALAQTVGWVFVARFADRIGKGIRGAPRDALVADIAPAGLRGAAFGLRQALDSVGALLGPLTAIALMAAFAGDIQSVMWFSALPAFAAVLLLAVAVREPRDAQRQRGVEVSDAVNGSQALPGPAAAKQPLASKPPQWTVAAIGELSSRYWKVVALGAVFTLARFSEAFLVLRAQDVGLAIAMVPLVMVVMNFVYAGVAYPAGAIADRVRARRLLVAGLVVLVLADVALALAATPWVVLGGAAMWGLHMGLTQGLMSKLVADTAPARLRGTAFGIFNLVSGFALLLASLIAGWLWARIGPATTFLAGASFAAVAAAGLIATGPGARRSGSVSAR